MQQLFSESALHLWALNNYLNETIPQFQRRDHPLLSLTSETSGPQGDTTPLLLYFMSVSCVFNVNLYLKGYYSSQISVTHEYSNKVHVLKRCT